MYCSLSLLRYFYHCPCKFRIPIVEMKAEMRDLRCKECMLLVLFSMPYKEAVVWCHNPVFFFFFLTFFFLSFTLNLKRER